MGSSWFKGYTGFYRVLPSFPRLFWVFTGFYLVLLGSLRLGLGFYQVTCDLNGFSMVVLGFNRVLPRFFSLIGFFMVSLGFTELPVA